MLAIGRSPRLGNTWRANCSATYCPPSLRPVRLPSALRCGVRSVSRHCMNTWFKVTARRLASSAGQSPCSRPRRMFELAFAIDCGGGVHHAHAWPQRGVGMQHAALAQVATPTLPSVFNRTTIEFTCLNKHVWLQRIAVLALCLLPTLSAATPAAPGGLTECSPHIGIVSAFGAEADILIGDTRHKRVYRINGNRYTKQAYSVAIRSLSCCRA